MPRFKKSSKKSVKSKEGLLLKMKGMIDVLPKDDFFWRTVFHNGLLISELYDFRFLETSPIERWDFLKNAFSGSVDYLKKKVFICKTKGKEEGVFRFNFEMPILRSYIGNRLGYFMSPLKVFCFGPIFYEQERHQWVFSILNDNDVIYDGQMILAALDFLKSFKIKNLVLKINTFGCRTCRSNWQEKLKNYYQRYQSSLCRHCLSVLNDTAEVFKILNCNDERCFSLREKSPLVLDYLCQNCNNNFKSVLEVIEDSGTNYELNPFLMPHAKYFNRLVFEIVSSDKPLEKLVVGGRMDYLGEYLFNRSVPMTAAFINLDPLSAFLQTGDSDNSCLFKEKPKVFLITVGDKAKKSSLKLMKELRADGFAVSEAVGKKTLNNQIRVAGKTNTSIALIIGQKEVFEETIILRDIKSGAQETIVLNRLKEELKRRLR